MNDIRNFKYILTIANEGSISAAAEKLFVSQPSLSEFLKNFEKTLNTRLFERTSSGVKPTYVGWRFIEMAAKVINIYNDFQRETLDMSQVENSTVILGVPSKRVVILSDILNRFSHQCPNVKVHVFEASSYMLENELSSGRIDVAMLVGPVLNADISLERVASEEVFIAFARDYPIRGRQQIEQEKRNWIEIHDIRGDKFIIQEKGHKIYDFSQNFFSEFEIKPQKIMPCCSFEVSIGWANAGAGLVFLPKTFINYIFQLKYNLEYYSIGETGQYRDFYIATQKPEKTVPMDILVNVMKDSIIEYVNA
jgi:DNA-binding transcriptional LysR family regulator